MIIDCHGHYTTAPPELGQWRDQQIAGLANPAAALSRASSHDAGRRRPPSRTNGWVRRWRPSSIADTI